MAENLETLKARRTALAAVLGSVGWNNEIVPAIAGRHTNNYAKVMDEDNPLPRRQEIAMKGRCAEDLWFLKTFKERLGAIEADIRRLETAQVEEPPVGSIYGADDNEQITPKRGSTPRRKKE